MTNKTIAILGAGSWGTAIALHLAKVGHKVMLWSHNPQQVLEMEHTKTNQAFLPDCLFPPTLTPSANLEQSLQAADHVIIAVPSHAFAQVLAQINHPLT
ncbi:MAG: NAD(P)-binding domain-containing protein, partial [Legionellales bacterium]